MESVDEKFQNSHDHNNFDYSDVCKWKKFPTFELALRSKYQRLFIFTNGNFFNKFMSNGQYYLE